MLQSIIFIFLQSSIISFIIMPFHTYKTNIHYINTSDFFSIQSFISNHIYSYLTIGTPPKKITANINFNEYAFNIYNNQCDIPSEYNSLNINSTTRINKGFILTDVYVDTYKIEDIFSSPFYSNNSFKLNYIYAPMDNNIFEQGVPKKKYTCANIGLKLSVDFAGTLDLNFLREIKNLDIIENYVFYLFYNDTKKEEGNLVIGNWPHEIEKDKYSALQYREIYAINNQFILSWMFRFDKIFLEFNHNNNVAIYNLTKNLEAVIDYNLNIIYGTLEFMELIENIFFNKYIKNGICKKNFISNNNLIYYECGLSVDLKTFPEIFFVHKTLSSKFVLSFEDVFVFDNNKYIFLIWLDTNENKNVWKLGKPFLKKYLFTFDLDKKTIGYYCNKKDLSNDSIKEEQAIYVKYTIIKLVLLSFIAFVLCYIITKVYYRKKKQNRNDKKLTELIYMKEEITQ